MRFLVGLLMVTATLAGCTDNDAYVPDEAEACVVESADDYSCDELPVGDPDDVAHKHDYWQGQDQMTILDRNKEAQPTSGGGIIACNGFPWYEAPPDDGFTVIQGTQYVEITMSWGEEAYDNHGPPELWVKTANMDGPEFVAPIENGKTITYEVTDNVHNDLPHSLISAWEFVWYSYPQFDADATDPAACYHWHRSDFHVQVDIVQGLEIPTFPAHPDHWDGGNITEMQVLNEDANINYVWGSTPESSSSFGSEHAPWDPWLLDDGEVVPFDADKVVVELDVEPELDTMSIDLGYHGANTWERTLLEPTRTEGTVKIYEIDIDRVEADGPYALQSLWEFWLYNSGDNNDFRGDIEMTVTVHKDAE